MSLTNLWDGFKVMIEKTTADMTAIVNRVSVLEQSLMALSPEITKTYTNKSSDGKHFRTITYLRKDNTKIREDKYMVDATTAEEHPDLFNLKEVVIYSKDGLTALKTIRYRVSYDDAGDIISETLIQ